MKDFILKLLTDKNGNLSHARVIALGVGFSATIFMWKLLIMNQMTIDFFIAYLTYGSGHQVFNKWLDKGDKTNENPTNGDITK